MEGIEIQRLTSSRNNLNFADRSITTYNTKYSGERFISNTITNEKTKSKTTLESEENVTTALREWALEDGNNATCKLLIQKLQSQNLSILAGFLERYAAEHVIKCKHSDENNLLLVNNQDNVQEDKRHAQDVIQYLRNIFDSTQKISMQPFDKTIRRKKEKKPCLKYLSTAVKICTNLFPIIVLLFLYLKFDSKIVKFNQMITEERYRHDNAIVSYVPLVNTPLLQTISNCSYNPDFDNIKIIISPTWKEEAIDLCHLDQVEILILSRQNFNLKQSTKISCPENVISVQLDSGLSLIQIKLVLETFYQMHTLKFVGNRDCRQLHYQISTGQFTSTSVTNLEFKTLSSCVNLYKLIGYNLRFPNLRSLKFNCASFLDSDYKEIRSIVGESVRTIECSDRDICNSLSQHLRPNLNKCVRENNCWRS